MKWHLDRTLTSLDGAPAVQLGTLQAPIAERPRRAPFEPHTMCRAGVVLLQRDGDETDRYRFYEAVNDVIREFGSSEPDLVLVRRYNIDGTPTAEQETLDLRDLITLRSLAFQAEAQYKNPPDRFLYVIRASPITTWESRAMATATFPTKRIDGNIHASLHEGKMSAEIEAPEHPLFVDEKAGTSTQTVYRKLVEGSIVPIDASEPTWRLDDVQFIGVSHSSQAMDSRFTFHVGSLNIEFASGDVAATREIFRGGTLRVFSHRIVPDDLEAFDYLMTGNAYILRLFDRDSRLLQAEPGYVALIHEGEPFRDSEIEDVQTVLQYLCGKRMQHLSTETFDANQRLSYRFRERSSPTALGLPPIKLDPWSSENANLLALKFADMVAASQRLRTKSPNGIAAAFHHYFEGANSSYPVSRTLMMAVAIDALIAAHVGNQNQVFLFDKAIFKRILKPLRKAAKEALAHEKINQTVATRFVEKLANLNNPSVKQRQSAFWNELGIRLSATEDEVLASRHNVVHEGHLGFEHTAEALEDNYRRSNLLATLFNRAMLSLLEWDGPCLDLTDDERKREIALASYEETGEPS